MRSLGIQPNMRVQRESNTCNTFYVFKLSEQIIGKNL